MLLQVSAYFPRSSRSSLMRWLLALTIVAQVADWATTEIFIRLGVPEANPLFRALVWPNLGVGMLAVKLGYALALTGAILLAGRILPRITAGVLAALTVAWWGQVAVNAFVIMTVSFHWVAA